MLLLMLHSKRGLAALMAVAACYSHATKAIEAFAGQELTRTQLISAARAGGDYLVRMQRSDGSFHYSYDPVEDRTSEQSYNILRHAGAVVALFDIHAATGDSRYLDAARRGITFLKSRFRRARGR